MKFNWIVCGILAGILTLSLSAHATKYDDAYPLYQQKKYSEAIPLLVEHCNQYPKDPRGGYTLAQCYVKTKQLAKAISSLKVVLEHHPEHDKSQFLLGFLYLSQKKLDEAETYLKEAVKLDPNDEKYNYFLGSLLMQKKNYPEAAASLSKAIQIKPGDLRAQFDYGRVLVMTGDFEKAIKPLKTAAASPKMASDVLPLLGACQLNIKAFDDALATYQKATQLNPSDADSFNNLGKVMEMKLSSGDKTPADYQPIIDVFSKAVALDDKNAEYHYRLGKAYEMAAASIYEKSVQDEKLGKKALALLDKAKMSYDKATSIDPNNESKDRIKFVQERIQSIKNPQIIEEEVTE